MKIEYERVVYPNQGHYNDKNVYLFTANSVLNKQGALVMGAGCAKSVRDTYKGIDILFGTNLGISRREFNITFVKWQDNLWIGAFQTKIDWRDPSPLYLVQDSIDKLKRISEERPSWIFHLPCPAISHGGLNKDEVLPLLESLPDNVVVYLDK